MIFLTKSFTDFIKALISNRYLGVFILFVLFQCTSTVDAQAFCNNPLGSLAPNLTWQYQSHSTLGYYTFNATAGCTYEFTYCSGNAPSASYSGDTYITISSGIVSGALVTNDDYCGLGSYLSWTAPSTGLFYFNVGNCCSPQCGAVATRTFGYRSTNCSGTTPAPTGITATNNTICSGQSVTLTALGAFGTQYWYTGSCGGAQVGTGATLTVSPNVTTTYFVNNNNGGQFGPSCASITITVNPSPAAPTVAGNTVFCGSASTTLTASGGTNYVWYSNAAGTTQVSTSASFTTPVLNSTTTYYVATTTGGAVQLPTYTFTTCSATGRFGPTQAQINTAYAGTTLAGQVTSNAGIQLWTVPTTGTYVIETRGAKGFGTNGGRGARMIGTFNLTAGQQLKIVVGQQAPTPTATYSNQFGGGGGSFVTLANNSPLIVAGGGGGSHATTFTNNSNGLIVTNGGNGFNGPTNGAGGIGGAGGGTAGSADGGGGLNGNGTGGGGGLAFINGANGGSSIGIGGFGGGGGTSSWNNRRAGGGGGYSGGGGAGSTTTGFPEGGGGGSFNSGTNQSNTAGFNTGDGQVIISGQGNAGCASALVPVTITINPSPTITVAGVTICSGQTATLTATTNMAGGTLTWSPGNLTGASINVSPNTTTQYTVSYTLAGCGTVTATATVTVNPSPAAPTANNVTLCGPGIATLTATGGQNNNYTWYSNSNGTGQLVTGASYTTPTISTTTTYYVGTAAQGGTLTGTQTFNYTGGVQTFTAPATGNYSITLNGGRGGNGLNTTGGLGGQATGSLALTAGQIISVYIGGQGGNAGGPVGWNGGGQGGLDVGASQHGGSGGGATDIRVGGTALANRVIVAGGGAGGGRDGVTGVGGGTTGTTSANFTSGYGGTGGTQAAGGVAWTLTRGATNGTLGIGGNGSTGYNAAGGGGGGGGYYGGGGGTSTQDHGSGWSAGGGGGSSFIGGVVGGTTTQGVQNGNGSGTISWNIVTIGCPSALTPVTVTVNPVPVVTVTNVTVCAGQQATLTATSTVPGGTFTWSPGGTTGATLTVTPNTTTTYTATYTVAGCPAVTGTGTVTINPLQSITGTLTACLGLTSQLTNAVTPGTWSSSNTGVATISGTGLVTGVSAGTSTITYNASNGCSTTSQFTVYPQPVLTATPSNVLCFGGTGSVNLSAAGANAPYTYGGSPTQNLQPGTYTYTATSSNGCVSAPVSITITQPQAALALSSTQVNVLCSGNNTGSVNLTVTGGTAPYTYAWSNNTTQEDPMGLAAGSYTVTVTDANGCTATTTVTITQPQAGLSLTTTQTNVGCFGNNTGAVDLTVTGGTAPYTYAWSNNTTQEDPTGFASGTYTVTVTDANGCTSTTTVTITQPQAPLALSTTQVNVLCFGNSTGSIDLTPTGGTAPYTYAWSNNTTQEDPMGLASGTYTVTVTDANGCTSTTTVTITQPQAPLALSTTQVNVLCFGNSTGSIDLTPTGGTAPYTYAWSNNTTQEDPTNLSAGTYTVTVTDANGCTATTTVTITQPQVGLSLTTTQTNVGCFGNNTGAVDLTVTGGTAPYTYAWSNNTTQEDPTGLASGTYTVTVTDANGCTSTTTVTITQPQAPLALSTTQVNVLCFGNSTGSIDLTPTGGTAPYTYAWSNNTTQEDPMGLASGTYTVTVTDANGCTLTTTVTITQPQAPLALSTTQVNVLCFGNSTGSIDLTPTGGTAPYTYAWSNNTTQEDPTNLSAGTYTVTVTDANGCTSTTTVTITQPQAGLSLTTTQTNVGCFGNNTGAVDLTVTGGTAPYSYLWSNNGTAEDPTGMVSGTYTVTVTDANGCTSTTTVTITQPQAPLALSTTQVNVLCFGNSTGSIDLTPTGGTAPYTYAWSNNTTQEDPTGLAAGTYTVTVTDANGCTSTTTVTITQPQAAIALSSTQVNVLCFGNSTGSIDLTPTGGTAPYTYAWSNNTTQEDPTNLSAGTYTVTVTDANGCTSTTTVTITQPQAGLSLTTTQTNVGCFGNNTGAVDLTVTGGTAPYSYLWSNNGTAEDPTGMVSGTYTVTVTDANGCTSTTTVTITQPQAPLALSTTQVNVLCFGNSTGSIDLTPTGGTAPYTYAWSNNTTQEDPMGLASGTYTVTVTDAIGCTSTTTVTITQPQAPLALSTTQVNVLCFGNSTGSIDLTPTGGTAPYTYAWSNNTTQEDPTNLSAGTYTVTVTDANGCTATTTVTITQPQVGLSLTTTQTNVGCFGNNTGAVDLTVTGGTAPYTYAWSNNTTQEDPTGLASGTYTVTVTDANGCTSTTTVTITQPQAPLALSTTQVNVLCFGNSTGSIDLTPTGGTAPYTYAWSNNTTQEDPMGLASGTYTVTVTDANGCTLTTTVTITQPQAPLALSTTQVNVLCFGNSTGSIDLTPTGGTAPYTYAWSNNTTQEDPTNLSAGTYTVTVTDANGCTSTTTVTITQPQAGLSLTTTQTNVGCFGNNTGAVDLTVTGGTAPYSYLWSNNGTAEDPTGMVSGTYTVTVTDANGCTSTTTVTITQPQAPLALSTTQVNVLCFGNSTGSIDLTPTGGTAPYTYAWSNNTTQEDPTGLAAGTYTVTVTDANGCTSTTTVTITQPQAPLALSTTQVNVLCFGNSTGSVNLTVTGGTAPYTYAWSNNTTQEDPTGLAAGSYTVTVTDANGCTLTTTVTITQPQAPLALSTTQVNVLCFGNSTGSVNLTVTGGTAPYTYAWSNNTTQEDPTGLAAGSYTVTVTDANGCTTTTTVTITQPQAPLALSTTQVNVLCFGNSTGSVNLTVTGGTAPYTYAWSNNTTLEDPTGLASGTYTVTVTDANGCTSTTTVTITQPQAPLALSTTQVNVLCFGNSTGSVNLTVTGGTAPYTYAWSNNTTQEDPTGLAAGTYTVTVTDANGCTSTTTVTITQPQAPLALSTTQVNVLCYGNSTGSVNLTVTGGTAPYTYAWSNNTTQEDPTGLASGTYTVTVTDANGCMATTTVTITQPQAPLALSTTQVNVLCFGNSTGSANLTVTGGTAPYTYAWSNNTTQEDPTGLAAGSYTVTVTDANGCMATTTVTITQPQAPLALSTTQVNVLCFGNSTGSVNLTVTGGTAPYTYAWSNNTTLEDPTGLASGTYTVTVTDANGCTSTTTVTITQPQAPLALSTTQVNVLCFGNNTGAVDLTVTGGTAPYTYGWSNNTTQEDPTNLSAGTYTVTVTDANGCMATTTVTITQPQAPLALSTTQVNVLCFGNSTGSVNLTVTGGTAPYTYAWSNNTIQEDPTGLAAGTYTVTVTDANGCAAQTTLMISQPLVGITLSTTQINVACFGNSSGSINLNVTGGTPTYSFLWSNGLTLEDLINLPVGTYSVTVSDNSMCTAQTSVTITQPQAPLALSTTQVNVLCFGNSTGSVNLTVTGGTAPYTYAWSNNTTLEDPTNLSAGTYMVTVTDANGCTAQTNVTITQPQAPLALSTTQVNVLCFGNNTGSVNLTVTGGTAPYIYAWSNNTTQEDPTGLAAGTYTVTVTDANGCTSTTTVTITQPQAPLALSTTQVNVLCFGNSTGSIDLILNGGTAPYTYAWSNNTTLEDPTNLSAGTYTVTVTDANGCAATTTVTITQPQAALALSTTQVNVLCFGNSTSSVNLTVTGGTAPYTYAWSNNTTQEDPTGLAAGTYTVTVTDVNGCTATTTVTITQPASAVTVTTQSQNILCLNGTGSVNSTPTGGVAPYTYSWTNNATTQNITNLQAGTYIVTVQDANGCTSSSGSTVFTTLSQLPVQILNITGTTILTCTNPTIVLQATGGVTYNWSGGSTPLNDTNSITQPGLYTVNMVDPNGCPVTQTITLTQNITPPTPGITNITGTTIIDCNAPSIDLQATGGGTYQWNNNLGTTSNVNITQAGTYTVVVTAANGCQDSATVGITVAPVPSVTVNDTTICSGQSVTLTPTYYPAGGQAVWTNGQLTPSITVSPNTTTMYSVLYTWNGCTATGDITVTVNPTPTVSATNVNICFGDTVLLTATPNLPNGSYNWITTNETTQSISVHPQTNTTYSVSYTLNGCTSAISTSTVTVTPLPIITVPNIIICEGATGTLTATANVAGGTYTWSQGGTTASITEGPQTTTSYNVSYTVNGCTSNTESPTITVNPLPNVSFTADTTSGCVPVVVNLMADTTGQQASYTWSSNGGVGSVGASAQMNFGVGGCYDVTLTATLNGCSYSVTQPDMVCVQDYPQASFEANPPSFTESTQTLNFNNTSVGATGYVWNFGDGNVSNQEYPEHLFQGTNDGYTITLIASTSMGCMDSTSVFIDANLGAVYYIPNSFTPDGNQFNQTFKPVFTTGISPDEFEMTIFNRWGEIMFESKNIFIGWDGSYGTEGLDCPSGTYTYKIVCTPLGVLEQKQIITGHVNLLR